MSLNKKKLIQRLVKENKTKQYPLLNLFILVSVASEIVFQIMDTFFLKLLKPIPVILMIKYISGKNSVRDHLIPSLIQYGFILSLIGNIVFMGNQLSSFMIGTIIFLFAHILYSIALNIGEQIRQSSLFDKFLRIIGSIGVSIIYCIIIYFMWKKVPNKFLYPLYEVVLCVMNISSIIRYEKTTPYSYKFMLVGSFLLGISSHMYGYININGIVSPFGKGITMLAEYGGQYLIMHGSLHHSNLQNQISKLLKQKTHFE